MHFSRQPPCAARHLCLLAALPPISGAPCPMGKPSGYSSHSLLKSPLRGRRAGVGAKARLPQGRGEKQNSRKKPPRTLTASVSGAEESISWCPGCIAVRMPSLWEAAPSRVPSTPADWAEPVWDLVACLHMLQSAAERVWLRSPQSQKCQ